MKKRTFAEIQDSKTLYRKYASQYKLNNYPPHRARRMLAYTSVLNKAIVEAVKR